MWRIDRRNTRQDPLLGFSITQPDGTIREQPFSEGIFVDPDMDETTRILAISTNEILIWHAAIGRWKIWFYDRLALSLQPFIESPRHGTWTSIRLGHEPLWPRGVG